MIPDTVPPIPPQDVMLYPDIPDPFLETFALVMIGWALYLLLDWLFP